MPAGTHGQRRSNDLLYHVSTVPIIPVIFLEKCHGDDSSARNVHNMTAYGGNEPGDGGDALGDARSVTECEEEVNTNLGLLMG